jgi:hypothetical protein
MNAGARPTTPVRKESGMTSKSRLKTAAVLTGASLALALSATFTGASAANAWASGIGPAPWLCDDTHFSGSSYHPIAIESRSSTYGAGNCFSAYTLSAQLRYATSGYTIAKTCITGGGGGAPNCQIIQTSASGSYTYYKGGRHGMGSVYFLT